jgi:hypothetical protein
VWQGPQSQPTPPRPPRRPRPRQWWQPWARVATAAVVALGVAVGAAYGATPSSSVPVPDAAPFYLAVFNLSVEPVMRYSGTNLDDSGTWQLAVTRDGEDVGTLTTNGLSVPVMAVGGTAYFKPPAALLSDLPGGESVAQLANTWITGDDSLTELLPITALPNPAKLAGQLSSALSHSPQFPVVGAPATQWHGTPALAIDLSVGRLYVTAEAPYRVLAVTPVPVSSAGASAPATSAIGRTARTDTARPAALTDATALTAGATPDFAPVTQSAVDQDYSTLIGQTQALDSAVDVGIKFSFNQQGNLSCSDSSCTVTETVDTSTESSQDAPVSGQVNASMTAAVTVDGKAGGDCTDAATLPVDGTSTMTCVDTGSAAETAQIKQQEQEQADEEAAADPGVEISVSYTIDYAADVQIEALADASAQVTQDVGNEQAEQQAVDQQAQTDSACPVDRMAARGGAGGVGLADSVLTNAAPRDCSALFEGQGEAQLQHSLNGHTQGGSELDPDGILYMNYYTPEDIRELIEDTVKYGTQAPNSPDPATGAPRPGTIYTLSLEPAPVGTTQGPDPRPLYEMQVVVGTNGQLITAYPYDPHFPQQNDS